MIIVGTAGWSLTRSAGTEFADSGSHLSRYSRVLHGTEINSSFARSHSTKTYAKWAKSTPRGFRFAVKMNQAITHDARLKRARKPLEQFLTEVAGLGSKLGPLLIQLPPSLEFDSRVARTFFDLIRQLHAGAIVCEPRHASWFTAQANNLLIEHHIGRVAADPASLDEASEPGGWLGPGSSRRSKGAQPLMRSAIQIPGFKRRCTTACMVPRIGTGRSIHPTRLSAGREVCSLCRAARRHGAFLITLRAAEPSKMRCR